MGMFNIWIFTNSSKGNQKQLVPTFGKPKFNPRVNGCCFYLEISTATPLPAFSYDDHLLFFEYFNIKTQSFTFLDQVYTKPFYKSPSLVPLALQKLAFPIDTKLLMFEELERGELKPLEMTKTLKEGDVLSGTVIVFQKAVVVNNNNDASNTFPSVIEFYKHLQNSNTNRMFKFRGLGNPSFDMFSLLLNRNSSYMDVLLSLSEKMSVDPKKIQLYGFNDHFQQTKPTTIKPDQKIEDMLTYITTSILVVRLVKFWCLKLSKMKPRNQRTEKTALF
eukprot:TRINITY_DN3109_c0_g2_i3.p1 TRINITY_DN3109_c0_g2~~TRINITY_DN3109_c0_g2_i3.p1  ORF type:complete len:276 (-),score=61.59 TRINITY_DN3109_c0_g2_i3:289-1116(-)